MTKPLPRLEKRDRLIKKMWLAGAPVMDIAEAVRLTPSGVTVRRIRLGLRPRKNGGWAVVNAKPGRGLHQKPMAPRAAATIRCLRCREEFTSPDKTRIRVCDPCKNTKAWRSGQDYGSPQVVRFRAAGRSL